MSEYSNPPEDSLPSGSPIPPGSSEDRLQKPKKSRKQKLAIWFLAVAAFFAIIWSFRPLLLLLFTAVAILFNIESHEERYGEIDHVLEVIDYKNSGVILQESYNGIDPFAPTVFKATMKGEEAFHLIKDKAKDFYDYDKCKISEKVVSCYKLSPNFSMSMKTGNTTIRLG